MSGIVWLRHLHSYWTTWTRWFLLVAWGYWMCYIMTISQYLSEASNRSHRPVLILCSTCYCPCVFLLNVAHLCLCIWGCQLLFPYRKIIFQHFWEWQQLIWSWNKLHEPETSWNGLQRWTGILLMLRTLRGVGCCLLIFIFNQQSTTWQKSC